MKNFRRPVSLLLALVMLFGMTSFSVSAAATFKMASETDESYADSLGYDFRQWMQDESRWASIPLGSSSCTIGTSGCTITALTKLIIEAGLAHPTEIDPSVVVKYLNELNTNSRNNGGFDSSGNLQWTDVQSFCSDVLGKEFTFDARVFKGSDSTSNTLTAGTNPTYSDMIDWMENGYHMVLNVKNRAHWLAVDEYETASQDDGNIYVMDSWRDDVSKRIELTLDAYTTAYYSATTYDRITTFYTDPDDTDNSNPDEYNTDDYRQWSRYDSRWATTVLDEPNSNSAEYVGEWGQALLALTKELIQAGVISSSTTPNDVLSTLQTNSLIGSATGVISWSSIKNFDTSKISSQTANDTTTINAENVISGIKSGKHYILRLASDGSAEGAWVAVDEEKTMATGELYVLTSGTDAGSKLLSDVLTSLGRNAVYTAHSFTTTSVSPSYVQLNYSGTNVDSLTAAISVDDADVTVASGNYVISGTEVTLTTGLATGYPSVSWSVTSGTSGTSDGTTYTVSPIADTTISASGSAASFNITYTAVSENCGFSYSTAPSSADYSSTVSVVLSVEENYTPTVSYTFSGETTALEPTVSGTNYTYSFTMPLGDVAVNVSATTPTYTVYLDAESTGTNYTVGQDWYAYTWSGDSPTTGYAQKWVKANSTKTAEGYYQFDNVLSNVIFVKINPSSTDDNMWNRKSSNNSQTDDIEAFSDMVYQITAWNNDEQNKNLSGTALGSNTIYLYPKAIDVHSYDATGTTQYAYTTDYAANLESEYYAYTYYSGSSGVFVKGEKDSNGILKFDSIRDYVRFVRVDPSLSQSSLNNATSTSNTDGDSYWGYTGELAVDTETNGDMYVLNRYYYADTESASYNASKEFMLGAWDNYSGVIDYTSYGTDAYKYWTKTDARWNTINLGTSTDSGNLTGNYYIAQSLAKLAIQAGKFTSRDVTDFAVNAFNSAGNHLFTSLSSGDTDTPLDLTFYSDTGTSFSSTSYSATYSTARTIYQEVLAGKHILLYVYNSDISGYEWVVVDEEKTLLNNADPANSAVIYVIRSTATPADNVGYYLSYSTSSIDGATRLAQYYSRKIVYTGGTTENLTRSFDYRTWSRYDGRWINNKVGASKYMYNNGACIIAVAKMFVQAGVMNADVNGNGIYDSSTDFTPEDLRYWLANNSGLVIDSTLPYDGALIWSKVNDYAGGYIEVETASNGLVYLEFDEAINGRTGYPDGTYSSADENDTLYQAVLQGYHMIMEIPYGSTVSWLVVDEEMTLKTGQVYVMDSEEGISVNADQLLTDKSATFNRVVGYKGATTPIPETTTDNGATIKNPTTVPSRYFDVSDSVYRVVNNTGAKLSVSVNGAVTGLYYRFVIGDSTYYEKSDSTNTSSGVMTCSFDELNLETLDTEQTVTVAVTCVDITTTEEEGETVVTVNVSSNTVTGTMKYKVVQGGTYKFVYDNRFGVEKTYTEVCVEANLEEIGEGDSAYLAPKTDSATIAAVSPGSSKVDVFKQTLNWTVNAASRTANVTTVNVSQDPEVYELTYWYYDENNALKSGSISGTYASTLLKLPETIVDYGPSDAESTDEFLGWYEASVTGEGAEKTLTLSDNLLSTNSNFGMIITKNTVIAPKFGTKTEDTAWHAYIDENYVTVEKSDDENGGYMYADFLIRYRNGEGTDVNVPSDATYGVLFVYSSDDDADTSAKSETTLKKYAVNATLLAGNIGNTNDGNSHALKVINKKGSSLSELNRADIAIQNAYNTFKGCHFTAYSYITYENESGETVTALSDAVTGAFPS